jgi:SAM-dependent methyltransferase
MKFTPLRLRDSLRKNIYRHLSQWFNAHPHKVEHETDKEFVDHYVAQGIRIAYDPGLVPPPHLMRQEGINVLEEWFRWGEEWSMLLRFYGHIAKTSSVLEIGCGLGRVAFPLRYILTEEGTYRGFEICANKVEYLQQTFQKAYPNFQFTWADVHNTEYNPSGTTPAKSYRFPYEDNQFDLVYAASVFTHMLPEATQNYFYEAGRVLKPGGRCVFSFFLLDHYQPGHPRPLGFSRSAFNLDYSYQDYGSDFAIAMPNNPENMTGYKIDLLGRFATDAGLSWAEEPITGFWSGTTSHWIGAQDLVVLQKEK